MGQRTYSTMECPYGCGASISQSGQARVAHYRKHVRTGHLIESRAKDWSVAFRRTDKPWPDDELPVRISTAWLKRLTPQKLKQVYQLAQADMNNWQNASHARTLSLRLDRIENEIKRRKETAHA